MRDEQGQGRCLCGGLGCHAAGPKHSDFSFGQSWHGTAKQRLRQIGTDLGWVANMNGRAVVQRKARTDFMGQLRVFGCEPAHGDDQRSAKNPCCLRRQCGREHPAIGMGRNARLLKGLVKGDARTDQKCDQVVAPHIHDIGPIGLPLAVDEHGISCAIGAQIRARCQTLRLGATRLRHFQHWASSCIALAIQPKIICVCFGQNSQIALQKTHRLSTTGPGDRGLSNQRAHALRLMGRRLGIELGQTAQVHGVNGGGWVMGLHTHTTARIQSGRR